MLVNRTLARPRGPSDGSRVSERESGVPKNQLPNIPEDRETRSGFQRSRLVLCGRCAEAQRLFWPVEADLTA